MNEQISRTKRENDVVGKLQTDQLTATPDTLLWFPFRVPLGVT